MRWALGVHYDVAMTVTSAPLPVAIVAISASRADLDAQVVALEDAVAMAGGRRVVALGRVVAADRRTPRGAWDRGVGPLLDSFAALGARGSLAEVWAVSVDLLHGQAARRGGLTLRLLRRDGADGHRPIEAL